jgi:hypothetical protein
LLGLVRVVYPILRQQTGASYAFLIEHWTQRGVIYSVIPVSYPIHSDKKKQIIGKKDIKILY